MISVSELFQAYYDCRKHKRNTHNALRFEQNLERNLISLYHDLINNTYKPGRSICFVVTKPKPREVWAADFRDRVVHHLIYNKYFDEFNKSFIFDSFACLPEKGTLRASVRLEKFIRSASKNYQNKTYFLKIDLSNFFMTINKNILYQILQKKIKDPWWSDLVRTILYHDPTTNVLRKNTGLFKLIPHHKSLYNAKPDCGLPIGNLSSQFFANVYLNELDQYCKKTLKIPYFIRYVDDIVMLSDRHERLAFFYQKMQRFVDGKLELLFHPNKTQSNTTDKGVIFVGYVVKHRVKYIKRTTLGRMYDCRRKIQDKPSLLNSLNSYFGIVRHTNSFYKRKKICEFFNAYGIKFDKNYTKMILKN